MADSTFRTVIPSLKAIDNGDGTYSLGVKIGNPSAFFDDVPVNGEVNQGITSNWAYDHTANSEAHHPLGALGATCWVVASDADAETIAYATALQAAGANVWVCDGTADDVQIQAAIDSGALNILLSEGTFNYAANVSSAANYLWIHGCGQNTVYKRASGSDVNGLTISGAYCRVSDLVIHGNKDAGDAPTLGDGLVITGATYLTLDNIRITHCPDYGIYSNNSVSKSPFWFHNVYVVASIDHNVLFSKTDGVLATNCIFSSSVTGGGLLLSVCVEHSYVNCAWDVNAGYGLYLQAGGTTNILISNCYFGGNANSAIICEGSNDATIIKGNTINENGTAKGVADIYLNGNTVINTIIEGNYFDYLAASNNNAIRLAGAVGIAQIKNNNFDGYTTPINTTTYTGQNVKLEGNQGYITPSEIRTASGSLTGGAANAILFSWHNPEAQDIYIKKVVIVITTADADAPNIDCGIADDATYTNGGTEFFDDLTGETILVYDSWVAGDNGQQTKWVLCQDSASATDGWVVAKILDNDGSSIVGSYYIEYVGK